LAATFAVIEQRLVQLALDGEAQRILTGQQVDRGRRGTRGDVLSGLYAHRAPPGVSVAAVCREPPCGRPREVRNAT
jgi:hypothetical protein